MFEELKKASISFPTSSIPRDYQPKGEDDPEELAKFALKLYPESPGMAAEYFLKAAKIPFSRELKLACLAAAAKAHLKKGGLQGFLSVEVELERELTSYELVSPPSKLVDIIALARFIRGERLPSYVPTGIGNLIHDLGKGRPVMKGGNSGGNFKPLPRIIGDLRIQD